MHFLNFLAELMMQYMDHTTDTVLCYFKVACESLSVIQDHFLIIVADSVLAVNEKFVAFQEYMNSRHFLRFGDTVELTEQQKQSGLIENVYFWFSDVLSEPVVIYKASLHCIHNAFYVFTNYVTFHSYNICTYMMEFSHTLRAWSSNLINLLSYNYFTFCNLVYDCCKDFLLKCSMLISKLSTILWHYRICLALFVVLTILFWLFKILLTMNYKMQRLATDTVESSEAGMWKPNFNESDCLNESLDKGTILRKGSREISRKSLGLKKAKHSASEELLVTKIWKLFLMLTTLVLSFSIPWEFACQYQKEVAKRVAVMHKGIPVICITKELSLWQSAKLWFYWQFSWSENECDKYYHAVLLDPVWEVSPAKALAAAITQFVISPMEMVFHATGRSFRMLLSEVPLQWQPIILVVTLCIMFVLLIMMCNYRLRLPFFFCLEPRTPLHERVSVAGSQCRECCSKLHSSPILNNRVSYVRLQQHVEQKHDTRKSNHIYSEQVKLYDQNTPKTCCISSAKRDATKGNCRVEERENHISSSSMNYGRENKWFCNQEKILKTKRTHSKPLRRLL